MKSMPRRERCRKEMPTEISAEVQELARYFRSEVAMCNRIEVWIDHAERRTWYSSEVVAGL